MTTPTPQTQKCQTFMHKLQAVALTELPAGFVSFQRLSPSLPPTQNNRSAVSPVLPADNSAEFVQLMQQLQ